MKRQLTKLQISFQIQKDLFCTAGHQQCVKSIRKGFFLLRNLAQLSITQQQCVMPHPRLQFMKRSSVSHPWPDKEQGGRHCILGKQSRTCPSQAYGTIFCFCKRIILGKRKKRAKSHCSSVSYTHLTLP